MSKPKSFRNPKFFDELIGKPASPVEPVKIEPATVEGVTVQPPEPAPAAKRDVDRLTVYLPSDLVMECKMAAVRQRVTVSRWMERAVRQALDGEKQ